MTTRVDLEYLLSGLRDELEDGLARLERADAATDHVAWYRHGFDRYVTQLRRELDRPNPDIHEIAVCALQAGWLTHIWPMLDALRSQRRGPDNLKAVNTAKKVTAQERQQRCLEIARRLKRPTPAAISTRYRKDFPGDPIPSPSSIRRYLEPSKK